MKNFYMIVGCGGTGSNLAPMLSRMMDKSDIMLLIDGDTVSVSNISRQTYQDFDVNKNKARSLAKKLNSCYQHKHFAIDRFLTSSDDLLEIVKSYKMADIYGGGYGFKYFIIAAVDNNKARLILENAFLRMLKEYNSVYYIDSGNEDTYGTLFISDKKNQVLRSKMFEMKDEAPVNEHCDVDTYDLSGFIASEKHQEALNKIKELSAKLDGMKDYDDMKKSYEKLTAEAEKGRRTDFIKSLGFNSHPELLVGSFDFSNLKYNETSKTYEGDKLEEITKAFKESYKDMLDEPSNNPKASYSHSFAPQPSGNGNNDRGYDEVLTKL